MRGSALDFCLVVTQRRNVADTALVIEGPEAAEWMSIAQAFAGPPGLAARPGQATRCSARPWSRPPEPTKASTSSSVVSNEVIHRTTPDRSSQT